MARSSVAEAIHGDSGLVLEQLIEAAVPKLATSWIETLRGEENARRSKMEAEIASESDPPNPLRVSAEVGKRLGPSDIVDVVPGRSVLGRAEGHLIASSAKKRTSTW